MLWWFAQTTLIAGGLAAVATLAGRWGRLGPEAKHLLWLLVLIKLAVPPLVAWPWNLPDAWPVQPRVEPAPAAATARPPGPAAAPDHGPAPTRAEPEPPAIAGTPPSPEEVLAGLEAREDDPVPAPLAPGREVAAAPPVVVAPAPVAAHPPEISNGPFEILNWQSSILALWLAGSVAVVARRGVKVLRFRRALEGAGPAPGWLVDEARATGERVGVRPPPVVATPRVATPLLWCLGRPLLVVPEALIRRLGVDRWPGILAHELAHLARGDHWVVRLELLVEAAWWWNPLFWLARRKLREHAEAACDARVVRALPERRFAYAESLVDVCEHIARSSVPSPALGVGGGGSAHSLEGRLHMILNDPIPRRPGRHAAALAALLAALAAPAWTLGQQRAEPSPSKPEAPAREQAPDAPSPKPAEAPAAEGSRPLASLPNQEPPSIDAIRAAQDERKAGFSHVSFRLVVAEREQSRQMTLVPHSVPGQSVWKPARIQKRSVKVAGVILDPLGPSRYDVLEARPTTEGPAHPAGSPVAWDRRLSALDAEGYTALEMAWDQSGPVPFRWLGAQGRQSFGDSLAAAFSQWNNGVEAFPPATGHDRGLEPLEPRPRDVLGMAGTPAFLDATNVRAEVIGLDQVDGRDAVRIAWSGNAVSSPRGLCWVAPELNDAVVLLNATQDPASGSSTGRRSWRRRSSDFVKVADRLWLPRKVTLEETKLDPSGGEPAFRRERELTFEDYRVDLTVADGTFRPKLTIRDLDDRTGSFTADPPALPSGLVDRLARAVRESPFGPPGTEQAVEELKAKPDAPKAENQPARPADPPAIAKAAEQPKPTDPQLALRAYRDIVANVDEAPTGRLMTRPGQPGQAPAPKSARPRAALMPDQPADPAKADPGIIANSDPGIDPIPTVDPKIDDPIGPRGLPDRAEVERRFKLDPEAIDLSRRISEANAKLKDASRIARSPKDAALLATKKKLDQLRSQYDELWERKSSTIRDQLLPDRARARDESEVLQARRNGRAAEVRKAEAQRALAKAVVARNIRLRAKAANMASEEEIAKADGELAIAEAEVEGRKAELAEADALLNQARRRAGVEAEPAKPTPAGKAPDQPAKPPENDAEPEAGTAQAPRRLAAPAASSLPSTPVELRDEIELMEVQLQGKQAELRAAEATADLVQSQSADTKRLAEKQGVSAREAKLAEDKARVARAQLDAKKAEVLESETRLKQARRRLEAAEARLRRDVERVKGRLEWSENMQKKGYVSKATYLADKAAYDELMIQLDPKYVPAPPAAPPDDPARKEDPAPNLDEAKAQLRSDITRAKDRLKWSSDMVKKGFVSQATHQADRLTYEAAVSEMKRLDPSYDPERPAPSPDDQSSNDHPRTYLSIKLDGEKARASGQPIAYAISLKNSGTEAARDVKVVASMPRRGGKLLALPEGTKFDAASRTLSWSIPSLEPGGEGRKLTFAYGTSTPGSYQGVVEATSRGDRAYSEMLTEVSPVAVLDLQVAQTARVMDVGKSNFYDLTIKNTGTKEATRLQLTGKLTKNLKVLKHYNVEKGEFSFNPETGQFLFPEIERLGVGQAVTLSLEVQATEAGPAGCHAFLRHAETLPDAKEEDVISTTVTAGALAKP